MVVGHLHAFAGKRVLVTGHTGFKGSWLSAWLHLRGADVAGLALEPEGDGALFERLGLRQRIKHFVGDIRDADRVNEVFAEFRPEAVFHLAAQSLVLASYRDPVYTFGTNVLGSVHVLEACSACPATRALVYITTDKCYENREWVWGYRENDRLGGHDPYSASKACAEIAFRSYADALLTSESRLVAASVRAGNVIGGGDNSANRIVPDCIEALRTGVDIVVRNPTATRPWQHVLDPLAAYLMLGAKMLAGDGKAAGSWNVGPDIDANRPVIDLVQQVIDAWGTGRCVVTPTHGAPHEAGRLFLNCDKIRQTYGWRPTWDFPESVRRTVAWYKAVHERKDPWQVSQRQIADFEAATSI